MPGAVRGGKIRSISPSAMQLAASRPVSSERKETRMNTVISKPPSPPPATEGFWLSQLSPKEKSTLIATFGGWALDGMDVMVYSFVIPSLIAAWHISKSDAGWLGTAALLMSSLGGWLAGLMADRFGRVRVLQITIVWFAVFTFLSGFTNNFWQLLFC